MRAFTAPLEEINAYKEAVDDIKKQKFPLHVSGCIGYAEMSYDIRIVTV